MADPSADASKTKSNSWTRSRRPLLPFAIAAIAGVIAASPGEASSSTAIILLSLTLGLSAWRARRAPKRSALPIVVVALLATSLVFAGLAHWRTLLADNDVSILFPAGQKGVSFEGIVAQGTSSVALRYQDEDDDEQLPALFRGRDRASRYYYLDLEHDADGRAISGRVKVYTRFGEDLIAGERVRVHGDLSPLPEPRNPGEFDPRDGAFRDGISALIYTEKPADSDVIGEEFSITGIAERYRRSVWDHVGRRLSIGNDALLAAIALGERTSLSPSERDRFVRTGTVHMLVVSGLHVFVMVWLVGYLLRICGVASLRVRELLRVVIALLFLFVSGGHIATLRAVIMVILFSLARLRGRGHDAINTLAGAALLVALIDPADVSSEGFALSFITVAAFLVFMPAIGALRKREDEDTPLDEMPITTGHFVKQSLGSTLIASLVTVPLVVSRWNIVTPVALIVNLLCIVPVFAILGASLFLPLAGIEPIAAALAWVLELMIGLLRVIVAYASEIEGGVAFMPTPSSIWVWAVYLALIALALRLMRWRDQGGDAPRALVFYLLAILISYLTYPLTIERAPDEPELIVLDMRQGSAIYLRSTSGETILFDCGSQGRPQAGSQTVAAALLADGVRYLDVLVLSHDDSPSVNGLAELLSRISIGEIWVSGDFGRNPEGAEALAWLEEQGQHLRVVDKGFTHQAGNTRLEVLWPEASRLDDVSTRKDRSDSASLVIALHGPETTALICGGVDDQALSVLIPDLPKCQWIVAPRHGGKLKLAQELLAQTEASEVILSAREGFIKEDMLAIYGADGRRLYPSAQIGALRINLASQEPPETSVKGVADIQE